VSEKSSVLEEVILAGPTCDSMDILYEHFKYSLPEDLEIGDRLYILSSGAYTKSYSSVEFNGFPPLKMYILR
jgi:ornithine decarboxylase